MNDHAANMLTLSWVLVFLGLVTAVADALLLSVASRHMPLAVRAAYVTSLCMAAVIAVSVASDMALRCAGGLVR